MSSQSVFETVQCTLRLTEAANFCSETQRLVSLHHHSVYGNKYVETQHLLKNKPHGLFTMHMMIFIIAILVNSKLLRENEKTFILIDFLR